MKEAYKTTIRDLKIARENQTFFEFTMSFFFNIGINYDFEIGKYEQLLEDEENCPDCDFVNLITCEKHFISETYNYKS